MKRILLWLGLLLAAADANAQQALLQGGSKTAGHVPMYQTTGSGQPIVLDSGPAGGNTTGQGISELNVTARGTGTAPYSGQGSGPNGETMCLQDAVSTNSTGYHYLCLSPNASTGKGLISFGAAGGAANIDLTMKVNGTTYTFPFSNGYVVGPGTSTVGHVACWNNTAGTLLSDCGTIPSTTPGGSSGQIQYNSSGSFAGFTMGGDATVNTSTGAMTITKIGNQNITLGGAFSTASSFATSGAFPIVLTVTGSTGVTLPTTGTLATLAGSEAFTNKTYNGNTWTAGTGTLTLGAGKTLTASNTITFTATDGSTLAIGTGGTLGTAAYTAATAYVPSNTQITNSLSGDVNLNNTGTYFTGPTVAQGSTGTWYCSGTVTLRDTATGSAQMNVKLWDGTTVAASAAAMTPSATNNPITIAVSGYIANPAGNMRISVNNATATTGLMLFNYSGNSKDSTLTCTRVN